MLKRINEIIDIKSACIGALFGGILVTIILLLSNYFTDDGVLKNNNKIDKIKKINKIDQINQINQIKNNNKIDKIDKINQIKKIKNNNQIKINNQINQIKNNNQIDVLSIKDDNLHKKIDLFVNAIGNIAKKNIVSLCKNKSLIINAIKKKMGELKNAQIDYPNNFNEVCKYSKSNFSIMNYVKRFSLLDQFNNSMSKEYNQLDNTYIDLIYYIVQSFFCKDGIVLLDKLEIYLIKVINSICSKSDNTIDKLENGIQYIVRKPLSYL